MFELCLVLGLGFVGVVVPIYYMGRAVSFENMCCYLIEYAISVPRALLILSIMVLAYPFMLLLKGNKKLRW